MRILKGLFLILIIHFLFSCNFTFMPDRDGNDDTPSLTWSDDMFEKEEQDDGITKTVFKINDPAYWTAKGTTIWTVWGENVQTFTERTVSMAKAYGYVSGGYGMVFCQGEYEVEGRSVHAMLVVMINNLGQYIMGKAIGGVFTDYGWWKNTSHLNQTPGSLNEVTVFFDETSHEYCLNINGYEVDRFTDNSIPALRSGKNGYIIVITPYDNFPSVGIDVCFLEEK